ncbi:MAG: TIM barrel protein [Candidatus Korarchaeota archaeon]|nr:TIM barrel protein [Candidatus Korarchaeota archaeon]
MSRKKKIHFGPAGKPRNFKGTMGEVPAELKRLKLDALEIEQVRRINISKEAAEKIREEAKKNKIILSLHAPYAINFASEKENVIEDSKKRLLDALRLAHWLNARIVVFHPGYYGKRSPQEALKLLIEGLKSVYKNAKKEGLSPLIGPETMGKLSQLGSLDEIIEVVKEIPQSAPVIDFAHLFARTKGKIRERRDYEKILSLIEDELGSKYLDGLHIHFSKMEYGDKGERKHLPFGQKAGPPFLPLAELLIDYGIEATIISESPLLEEDAIVMQRIVNGVKRKSKRETLLKLE